MWTRSRPPQTSFLLLNELLGAVNTDFAVMVPCCGRSRPGSTHRKRPAGLFVRVETDSSINTPVVSISANTVLIMSALVPVAQAAGRAEG